MMPIRRKALGILVNVFKGIIALLGERNGARVSSYFAERLSPTVTVKTNAGTIRFFCPGEIPLFRAETLLTKEPDTIEWIDTFEDGSVFWDIGANVGVYSLYAALKSNVSVLAFEPSAFNYHLLNRNIHANKMDNTILSFCIAFNDTTCLDHLYMADTNVGGALSSFAEAVDWQGGLFTAQYKQGMIGFSIDEFIERFFPPFPNHIKIDVDGIESKIINGAKKTISDERLRTLLVELDADRQDYCQGVIGALERAGMKLAARKHGVMPDKGKFASVWNHIFVRQ